MEVNHSSSNESSSQGEEEIQQLPSDARIWFISNYFIEITNRIVYLI